jgi:beta-glucosidase
MKRVTQQTLFIFTAALLLTPLAVFHDGTALAAESEVYKDPKRPVEERVNDLLGRMTVEEKIAQLQCQTFDGKSKEKDSKGRPRDYNLGFVVRFDMPKDPLAAVRFNNEEQRLVHEKTRLGIPLLNVGTAKHAVGGVFSTLFPQSIGQAATFDEELLEQCFEAICREARAVNVRLPIGPFIYFSRDARYGRIEETFGEDPFVVKRFGLAMCKAQHTHSVLGCLTFFVANYGDGGRDSFPVYYSERMLREVFFPPFEACVRQYGDMHTLMPCYNSVNGLPCHANPWLLTDVLRKEWGFQGCVISDWGDHALGAVYMHRIAATPAEGAAMVVAAGCDSVHPNGMAALPEAVQKGLLPMATLNQAVARVLRMKFRCGLFDKPIVDESEASRVVRCQAHQDLALKVAQKSIVLLKNEKQTLPLKKSGTLGVFGPAAQTFFPGGYGRFSIPSDITPLAGLKERVGNAVKLLVHDGTSDPADLAKQCDAAVIFVTIVEGEAFDRASLDLPVFTGQKKPKLEAANDLVIVPEEADARVAPGDQEALIRAVAKTGVPTVVVLVTGAPVTMQKWIGRVPAVVQMFYAGEKGGLAIADVLFGDVNPGGKLPITFPKSVGQVPIYYNVAPWGRSNRYWDDDGKPQFPFGHGLSYTTFELSNLKVASTVKTDFTGEVTVTVDVKNTGPRAGDDVVQVYLRDELASVVRPNKELKGFARVTLKAGEKKTAAVKIVATELSLWNREMKRVIEPGWFTVMIGRNAEDVVLKSRFEVK